MHRHPNPVGDEREILREGGVPPHRPSGERSWSHRGGQPIEPGCRIAACPVDGRYSAGPLAFVVDLNRGIGEADQVGVALPLPVSLTAELGVTTAQTEHMPFYLRVFFRVLSSWVHYPKSPRSRAPCGGFEQRLRARLQGSGPALAPRRTRLRPRCDLNGRPRPRLGQLPRGDARQGELPTCDQPLAGHVPPGSRHPDQPDKILRDRTQLSTSWRRRNPATSPVVQQGEDDLVSPAGLSLPPGTWIRGLRPGAPVGRGTDGRIGRW
jgi:hypothetical protein